MGFRDLTTREGTVRWRMATPLEISDAQSWEGAPHVTFGCTNCGDVAWASKNLSLNNDGGYNGMRNIFFLAFGRAAECKCPARALRMVVAEE